MVFMIYDESEMVHQQYNDKHVLCWMQAIGGELLLQLQIVIVIKQLYFRKWHSPLEKQQTESI